MVLGEVKSVKVELGLNLLEGWVLGDNISVLNEPVHTRMENRF